MDGANANFMETSKEIFGNVHGLLEILHPDVDAGHDERMGGASLLLFVMAYRWCCDNLSERRGR